MALLGSFKVKNTSSLYKYAEALSFSVHGLSDSFCRLDIEVFLNDELCSELSVRCTTHIDDI